MFEIKNKIAVVTGSGRGIGKTVAISLAKEGAKVVVNVKKRIEDANETLKEIKKYSDGIVVQADVSSRENCKKLVNETFNKFGKCDILVNNAGISIGSPFLESDDNLIQKIINTNLMSAIYCSQEFGKNMNNGVILNISSLAGLKPMKFISIYGISKSALISLTKYLAVELADRNIRINAIAPSVVKTVMGESLFSFMNMKEEEYVKKYTLTHKLILPEEVSEAALFLIKSENITGQTIIIDSGQLLLNMF